MMDDLLSGELSFHLFNTVILTAGVSIFVLWRYRCAVLKGMCSSSSEALPLPSRRPIRDDHQPTGAELKLSCEGHLRQRIVLS
jgi:hypothetical protein